MATVLIVDDSSFDRLVIRKCLENNDHSVVGEATNAQEALELYRKQRPDVVILDIYMNNENGINVLRNIMSYDENANVIMCTSSALQTTVIQANQLGAKYFLAKPVTEDVLLKTINKILLRQN